jgi:2-C-methyl-D-erythritol 4-phosphate cytidylyltransferase
MTHNNTTRVAAVIVAAGQGLRMGGIDKVLSPLATEPILLRATRPFQESPLVTQIVIVVAGEKEEMCRQLTAGPEWTKVTHICMGGPRRQDSVAEGLKRLKTFDYVLIHDGARPLVTADLIERGLEAAQETGAAVAAVPVTDTIKRADKNLTVLETLSRENLWAVQTPQVFRSDVIQIAHLQDAEEATDDAALVERLGHTVKLYRGAYDNIKITTPDDLAIAEAILRKREELS